ncbi:hypothetical protein V6N13_142891 [Hibiscus sabdariffa]
MRVLSWNVRGLGSSVKRSAIHKVLRQQRIEMVFLVETKLEVVSEAVVKSLWWTDSYSFLVSASEGLSGSIIIIWEVGKFVVSVSYIDPNFVLLRGTWCVEDWACAMIAFYAPCGFMLQQDLWRKLVSMIGSLTEPICCGGDFNVVLSLDERRRCVGDKRVMAGFASFVEEFCGLEQFILKHRVSDHAPVRLSSGVVDWGPRPFRFLNCWLEKRGHVKLMESEWRRISEEVSMPVSILEKLRRLKGFLKVWNRESFGSVDLQIEVTTDLLNDLEGRVE